MSRMLSAHAAPILKAQEYHEAIAKRQRSRNNFFIAGCFVVEMLTSQYTDQEFDQEMR